MGQKSIFYRYPWLYINGLKLIHGKNFAKRYDYMASFVKRGDAVLEPGCGPAILPGFLKSGVAYQGFDANEDFVKYARKKYPQVFLGNVLEEKNYSRADVVIVCDVLHHLNPKNRKKFISYCHQAAKRLFILCEPTIVRKKEKGWLMSWREKLGIWGEQDGTNQFSLKYYLNYREHLGNIKSGFGIMPAFVKRKIKIFGDDLVVVFEKKIFRSPELTCAHLWKRVDYGLKN